MNKFFIQPRKLTGIVSVISFCFIVGAILLSFYFHNVEIEKERTNFQLKAELAHRSIENLIITSPSISISEIEKKYTRHLLI